MARIDIARIRKERGMSQNELAQLLQITQSFLSAIENGKSPLPPEKETRIMEIFHLPDFEEYLIPDTPSSETPGRSLADFSEGDLFNQLLNRFHDQAHKHDHEAEHHSHHDRIAVLEDRNDRLLLSNDRLLDRNDQLARRNMELTDEVQRLRDEVFRLKELLLKAGL